MEKKLISFVIILMTCMSAMAQVPTVMMYQLQIKHGKAAAQDITVQMQLRKTQSGEAIWTQTFSLTGVNDKSVQNLGLDFGSKINWNDGPYWLATFIDGEEMGCAQLTSVPYSFIAKQVEGVIAAKDIIGKWKQKRDDEGRIITCEFREDGSFSYSYQNLSPKDDDIRQGSGTWEITPEGYLYYEDTVNKEELAAIFLSKKTGHLIINNGDSGAFDKTCILEKQP